MNERAPRFGFYEKVRVDSQVMEKGKVNGQVGAVLGRVQTEDRTWYYTIYIYSTETSWCFFEHELSPTGESAAREDFYDGSSVHVEVDVKGRGGIISDK